MSIKLLFITSHYFYQPTVDALARLNIPCETTVIPYNDYSHISEVYGMYADKYDACLTSGIVAMNAIRQVHTHISRPLTYFQVSENGLHRYILKVMLETRNMNMDRIAMDFLAAVDDRKYSVTDFLKLGDLDQVYDWNMNMSQQIGVQSGKTVEHTVVERITKLWKENAIDLVICQYSSIVPMLQERGIPFRCPFILDRRLKEIIQEVLVKLELNKLHDNHSAIIQIFPQHNSDVSAHNIDVLYGILQEYINRNLIDCILQKNEFCCTVISSLRIIRFLTDDFQKCRISGWLEQNLGYPVSIAYGIGTTVPHAMNNVQIASKEAKLLGQSFVVDSNGNLIGPLNSEQRMVIAANSLPDTAEIARRCSLSAMTIQKLMSIVQNNGSNKITTQDLAMRLDTTVRNANRIMQNLCKGNIAKPVYTQSSHSRGRPVQVYALDFENTAG